MVSEASAFRSKDFVHHLIFKNFCLVVSKKIATDSESSPFSYFRVDNILSYVGFCDDFGPMSLGTVSHFCSIVDFQLANSQSRPIAMISTPESQSLTNAIFLIGAYMIMKLNLTTKEVEDKFEDLNASLISFKDVSPGLQNFSLHVKDCWAGLHKAKELKWAEFGPDQFDILEYTHFDSPANADLHEIVPGKFVAMRGPIDLPLGARWKDVMSKQSGLFSHREFSPVHYVDILHQFDVQAVVRLNAPEYSSHTFAEEGIAVVDLFFEDCTSPPLDVVAKFMAIAEGLPGTIAVHCKAGLGRTGTLIALYMMKHYGFTAREAIGWIRIVRPGSIIGGQQEFLCSKEAQIQRGGAKFLRSGPHSVPDGPSVASMSLFAHNVGARIDVDIRKLLAGADKIAEPTQSPTSPEPDRLGMSRAKSDLSLLAAHVSESTDRRNGIRAQKALSFLRTRSLSDRRIDAAEPASPTP